MNTKFYVLFSLLALTSVLAVAQDFNNYQLLEAKGEIPGDFLLSTTEKVEAGRENTISEDEKKATRKTKEEFLLGSNFIINRLLGSGRVLFNDPVSEYLNEVMDNILEHNPDLKYKVRVYAVKSSSVNAFATHDGIIMVNLGLLAQLETEAQLAYILCHELIHYQNKHVIDVYLENDQIEKGKGSYRGTTLSERILSSSNYSKEIETEADMEGLKLFLKTDYSTESVKYVFDVLHYAYLPFDDIEFEKSFFESEHLIFPAELFLEEVADFSPFEEEDDSRSSHPSTYRRKMAVTSELEGDPGEGEKDYLVSKEKFDTIRKICRFELSNLYLKNEEYEMAIYNSYMLLKDNPDSKYLKKNICKALYCISKYSNNNDFYSVHTRYKKAEGSSQQLYHLFEKMTPKERNALALRYAWLASKKYPEDEDLKKITNDLMKSLVDEYYEKGFFKETISEKEKSELSEQGKKNENDTLKTEKLKLEEEIIAKESEEGKKEEVLEERKEKKLSKYEKIRKRTYGDEEADIKNTKEEYIRFAFVDLFNSSDDFKTKMEDYIAKKPEKKEYDGSGNAKLSKEDLKKARMIKKRGHALGIGRVVIVSPYFMNMDLRKGEDVWYEKSEAGTLDYIEKIKTSANLMGLETELVAIPEMDINSVDKFNDLAFLNNWLDTRFYHLDQEIVDMEAEKLKQLIEKYDTRYFCWTGLVNLRKRNIGSIFTVCAGIFIPYFLPFAIYSAAKPHYETYFYCIVFDFETSESVMSVYDQFNQGDALDYVNVHLYDVLYQIKSSRK